MSYEYKGSIKEDLQHLYEIPTGVWKYKEKLDELDEVYAKAQAFDEILRAFESAPTKDYAHLWIAEDAVEIICKYKGQLP